MVGKQTSMRGTTLCPANPATVTSVPWFRKEHEPNQRSTNTDWRCWRSVCPLRDHKWTRRGQFAMSAPALRKLSGNRFGSGDVSEAMRLPYPLGTASPT